MTTIVRVSDQGQLTVIQASLARVTLDPAEYLAARERQGTAGFTTLWARQAEIERTLSQSVRTFESRQARYRGPTKTHLQHVATAIKLGWIVT